MPFETGTRKHELKARASPSPALTLRVWTKWTTPERVPNTTLCALHDVRPTVMVEAGAVVEEFDSKIVLATPRSVSSEGSFTFDLVVETPYAQLETFERRRGESMAMTLTLNLHFAPARRFARDACDRAARVA